MEKISMCRICLVENVRMFVVGNKDLQETYEKLTNTPFVTEDSRPMLACVFCYTRLKQCCQLQRKCLEAETLLNQMLNGVFGITPLKIKEEVDVFGGYIRTAVQHVTIDRSVSEDGGIKEEPTADRTDDVFSYQFKVERNEDLELGDAVNGFHEDDMPTNLAESDSEDDVPLVKFKFEVEEEPLGTEKKKKVKNEMRKPDCSEIILSKEEQLESLLARSKSSNYLHSPYKCNSCYKGFVDTTAYENHKMKHDSSSGPHICDICHMRYRSVQLMRTHASTAHARIFKCNKCGHVSHTSNQARIHEKWHDGHTYECQLCSHTFRKPTSYLSHMRKRHPTEHVCNICGETFVGKHGLQMHKRKTHINGEKPGTPLIYEGKLEYFGGLTTSSIEHITMGDPWQKDGNDLGEDLSADDDDDDDGVSLKEERHSRENYVEIKVEPFVEGGLAAKKTTSEIRTGNMEEKITTQQKKIEISRSKVKRKSQNLKSKPETKIKIKNLQKNNRKKGEIPYKCDNCQRSFVLKHHLTNHMRIHSGEKPFKCNVCQRSFRLNKLLTVHLRVHTGEKPYKCEICPKRFSQSAHLKHHVLTHTGEKPYKCDSCPCSFRTKTYLDSHIRTHTGEKPYKCEICQLSFINRQMLKNHIISGHNSGKPYKCDICDRGFNHKNNLEKHVRIHTGEKPYKCDVCQKSFIQKHALDIHVRNKHTGEKPYKCAICQRSFSASSVLKNHMITHTGEKPYKCDICFRSFNRKGTLSSHIRTHSDEKQYQCEICAKSFRQVSTLYVHLRVHNREKQ